MQSSPRCGTSAQSHRRVTRESRQPAARLATLHGRGPRWCNMLCSPPRFDLDSSLRALFRALRALCYEPWSTRYQYRDDRLGVLTCNTSSQCSHARSSPDTFVLLTCRAVHASLINALSPQRCTPAGDRPSLLLQVSGAASTRGNVRTGIKVAHDEADLWRPEEGGRAGSFDG